MGSKRNRQRAGDEVCLRQEKLRQHMKSTNKTKKLRGPFILLGFNWWKLVQSVVLFNVTFL